MTPPLSKTISVHQPVMVSEVVSNLINDPNGIYVDGTVGLGGHAIELLALLGPKSKIIGIDRDKYALSEAKQVLNGFSNRVDLFENTYSKLDDILNGINVDSVSGILLDLGLSSAQLADEDRGFSYDSNGSLDMRFDIDSGMSVKDFFRTISEQELADIIWSFGEERYSRKIAYNIKTAGAMETVGDLREAIRRSTPPKNRNRSFARVFQALRIAVNDELQHLGIFLEKFIDLLNIDGRIIIISYHSLEDRLVKFAFKKLGSEGRLNILTKKPLTASESEILQNSRSKSAKMRIGERIL